MTSGAVAMAAEPVLRPRTHDPRVLRKLPWYPNDAPDSAQILFECATVGFYMLTLLVLPVGYGGWLVRWRRWSLRKILLAPVVVGLMTAGWLIDLGSFGGAPVLAKLLIAAMGLPVLAFLALTIRWCVRRRWLRLAVWQAVTLLAAGSSAAVLLLMIAPMQQGPLQPGERWDTQGWYWIWFGGAYTTGLAMVTLLPAFYGVRAAWRRFQTRRRSAAEVS